MLLIVLRSTGGGGRSESLVDDGIGSFAEEFDLAGPGADDDRHAFAVAAELEHVQEFIHVLRAFEGDRQSLRRARRQHEAEPSRSLHQGTFICTIQFVVTTK